MFSKHAYLTMLLSTHLIFSACAQTAGYEMDLDRATLKLANGNSISETAYDDYSPIIVRLSNGYLALVFGSTRSCALSCTNHNIFVASSVSAYVGSGTLPAFNTPQPFVMNGFSPLNYGSRPRLAAVASGTNVTVYLQTSGGQIMTSEPFNPVSASPINLSTGPNLIMEYMCYSNNMLGLDATGQMIAANTAGTQVYRFNPNTSASQCMSANVANPKLSAGTHISLMRQSSTGISDGYVVSDTAGKVSAQSVTSSGPQLQVLVDGLARNGLVSTGVSVMQGASEAGDLITFSAATAVGNSSDLYLLLAPKPAELWKSYVAAGMQPSP